MRQRFAERIELGLTKLTQTCERVPQQPGVIERRVGRLLERNQRAARFYDICVSATASGAACLQWRRRADAWQHACAGILRSHVTDWSAEELWRAYIQLTEAEAAFRIQKDSLQLRPVWHQIPERVTAHILVCFLAYVLRKTLEGWCRRAGLGSSTTTVLEEMARLQSTDVVVPTQDGPARPSRSSWLAWDWTCRNACVYPAVWRSNKLRSPKCSANTAGGFVAA